MPRPPLAGTSEPLSMVRVYHGATQVGLVRADESGQWAVRPEQDLPDGRFEFQATATDFAGNVLALSSITLAPSAQIICGRAFGLTGAAVASALTLSVRNFVGWLIVAFKLKLPLLRR